MDRPSLQYLLEKERDDIRIFQFYIQCSNIDSGSRGQVLGLDPNSSLTTTLCHYTAVVPTIVHEKQ